MNTYKQCTTCRGEGGGMEQGLASPNWCLLLYPLIFDFCLCLSLDGISTCGWPNLFSTEVAQDHLKESLNLPFTYANLGLDYFIGVLKGLEKFGWLLHERSSDFFLLAHAFSAMKSTPRATCSFISLQICFKNL